MRARDFDLVQPILVPRTGVHEETVRAVALASVLAHDADPAHPAWERWLQEAPAKSVRKVKAPGHLDQVEEWARAADVPHARREGILALVPMAYEQMPPRVRGAQVQGVNFPRRSPAADDGGAPASLEVLTRADLSTGKAAAQAAHALWAWRRRDPTWTPRHGVEVAFVSPAEIAVAAAAADVAVVHDGGFTEVSPGTLTAVARRL